jgi:hypothetical protein
MNKSVFAMVDVVLSGLIKSLDFVSSMMHLRLSGTPPFRCASCHTPISISPGPLDAQNNLHGSKTLS